jgi:hypothetical protein
MWLLTGATLFLFVACHTRVGAISPRIANPDVTGVPRPVEFLFGWSSQWLVLIQAGFIGMVILMIALCVRTWRRQPAHPNVLMTLAATALYWLDPPAQWVSYTVFNPQLLHLPEDWAWAKVAPTVQPFLGLGYAAFFFGPFFPAMALLRRLQARAPTTAFVWRHPIIVLGGLAFAIGIVIDACLENFLVNAGLYLYSQVVPFGSLFVGTPFQFPLIWESGLISLVMIPAAVLCYRDDTGRSMAENLSLRLGWLPHRPKLASFLVMFASLNVAYVLGFCAPWWAIRVSGAATAVACPYSYPEAKVYDPQGYYEREGAPGPYFEGVWNTWMTGQPDGRPKVNPVKPNGYCKRSTQ